MAIISHFFVVRIDKSIKKCYYVQLVVLFIGIGNYKDI